MPDADFQNEIPGNTFRSDFFQLSKKGDRIKFRMFAKPFYIAKHWITDQEAINCSKLNSENRDAHCEYCEKFENGVANPNHRSGSYKPNLQFYYPIINRGTHIAQIFQTSISVHMAIKEAADAEIDVYKADWQVTRNEGSPANYYGVVRLDPTPITEEEKQSALELKPLIEKLMVSLEAKISKVEPKAAEEVIAQDNELDVEEVGQEIEKEEVKKPSKKATTTADNDDLLDDIPF
jgi:hypothetical protein